MTAGSARNRSMYATARKRIGAGGASGKTAQDRDEQRPDEHEHFGGHEQLDVQPEPFADAGPAVGDHVPVEEDLPQRAVVQKDAEHGEDAEPDREPDADGHPHPLTGRVGLRSRRSGVAVAHVPAGLRRVDDRGDRRREEQRHRQDRRQQIGADLGRRSSRRIGSVARGQVSRRGGAHHRAPRGTAALGDVATG